MYPPRFDYLAPTSVEEVLPRSAKRGGEGDGRRAEPHPGAEAPHRRGRHRGRHQPRRRARRDRGAEGELRIGALVRHADAERSPLLTKRYGLLGATARLVADPLVRNRGTICGSLAHADPQGDWGSAMLAARASVVVRGAKGERTIAVDELALGPFTTTLEPDEVITGVRVPDPGPRTGGHVPEARAQGRRLRDGRSRRPGDARQRPRRPGGDRADGRRRDEPARDRRRGRAARQRADRRRHPGGCGARRRRRPSRNPTTAAPRNTRGTSCASSASAAFALRSRPPRPARSDGHDPARIAATATGLHTVEVTVNGQAALGRRRGAAPARPLPPPDARAHRDAHRLRHDELRRVRRARRRDAGEVVHDARRPGERRRDHDRRGARSRAVSCTRSSRRSTRSTACSAASARRG